MKRSSYSWPLALLVLAITLGAAIGINYVDRPRPAGSHGMPDGRIVVVSGPPEAPKLLTAPDMVEVIPVEAETPAGTPAVLPWAAAETEAALDRGSAGDVAESQRRKEERRSRSHAPSAPIDDTDTIG